MRDNQTGETVKGTIEVNHPLTFKGVSIYQSSFEDGGSKLKLSGFPMTGSGTERFEIAGEVGSTTGLNQDYTVEWSGFRPFNVENVAPTDDPRAVKQGKSLEQELAQSLDQHTGSAGKKRRQQKPEERRSKRQLQAARQDRSGARIPELYAAGDHRWRHRVPGRLCAPNPSDNFSYLRIPADDGTA